MPAFASAPLPSSAARSILRGTPLSRRRHESRPPLRRALPLATAVMPSAAEVGDGLVPKRETGVAEFLSRYPDCNGDGVVVAVLDTGVDPGAPGLRTMPDGSPKVVDCIDCTGGGDVEMFDAEVEEQVMAAAGKEALEIPVKVAAAPGDDGSQGSNEDGSKDAEKEGEKVAEKVATLQGLSGRVLVLGSRVAATNPTHPEGYRVGLKSAYALLPKPLVSRLQRERRVEFDRAQRAALVTVRERLDAARARMDAVKGKEKQKAEARLDLEEAEAAETGLIAAGKMDDPGPVYDCVTWFDGNRWRAVVDTTESGDLSKCFVMEDYRWDRRFATLYDLCNYTVNVWDEGRTLSICVDSGSHGTHVAGMIGAYYPDTPHMNGTAPGARIVSLKIGDTRLSAMETHQGLNRAVAYMLAHSRAPGAKGTVADDGIVVDVANMSFGEPTRKPNHGRFVELATQLVREHNVPFFCSAGNNGPGLTSVSAPGGTTDALIGVGAYVTPGMLTEGYSVLSEDVNESFAEAEAAMAVRPDVLNVSRSASQSKEVDAPAKNATTTSSRPAEAVGVDSSHPKPVYGMPYTWTSRGPAADGGLGVSVCAPGGAIAAIPQWTLSRKRLMNGTSMASPCACSSLAVVLSYLKKRKIPYTSDLIRTAMENSARPLTLSQLSGSGVNGASSDLRSGGDDGSLSKSSSKVVYTEDLVFGGGSGSISVVTACALIEKVAGASKAAASDAGVSTALPTGETASPRDVPEGVRPPLEWRYEVALDLAVPSAARKCVASSAGGGILGGTRGVYLRGKAETRCIQRMSVKLDAVRDDEKYLPSNKAALAAMETTIILEATKGWVTVPKSVLLYGAGRAFPISVDPTCLAAGKVHYAEIAGYVDMPEGNGSSSFASRYRVFRVPVTVVVPEMPLAGSSVVKPLEDLQMSPGAVTRRFYAPPIGSTYGILRITAGPADIARKASGSDPTSGGQQAGLTDADSDVTSVASTRQGTNVPANDAQFLERRSMELNKFSVNGDASSVTVATSASRNSSSLAMSSQSRTLDVHIVQVEPRQPTKHTETRQTVSLVPGATREVMFPLGSAATVEIAIGHRWSSMGSSHIRAVDVVFCGLQPKPDALHMEPGASCFPRLDVRNLLPDEEVGSARPNSNAHVVSTFHPKATLSSVRRPISPFYSKISQLSGDRDRLPDARQLSQLILEYKFVVHEDGTSISISFPGINGHVYDGDVEGGPFVTLHDANKQLLLCSDIYPDRRTLKKGTYYARAMVRHDRTSVLEKLKDSQCVVTYRLSSIVNLNCYDTAQGAALLGDTSSRIRGSLGRDWKGLVEPGETRSLYFGMPSKSSVPKWISDGDSLHGHFSVDEAVLVGSEGSRQAGRTPKYRLSMPVPAQGLLKGKPMADILVGKNDFYGTSSKKDCSALDGAEEAKPPVETEGDDSKWLEDALKNFRMKALKSYLKDSKLVEFDRMCRSMPDNALSDCDFLLLKLQRVDATLCGGGGSPDGTRQEAVQAVVSAADELLARLNAPEIAAHFGLRSIDSEKSEETKEMERRKTMIIAALFRKSRALHTPGRSIAGQHDDDGANNDSREKAFDELQRWQKMDGKSFLSDNVTIMGESGSAACVSAEDFMLLVVNRHKMHDRYALALRTLMAYLNSSHAGDVTPRRLADLRLHLLQDLKWHHVVASEKQGLPLRYPRGLEPL